jgi:hypothetical protein
LTFDMLTNRSRQKSLGLISVADPDPLVRGIDPDPAADPDPFIIKQK